MSDSQGFWDAFCKCLKGEPVSKIEGLTVHSRQSQQTTILCVLDEIPGFSHKYILASARNGRRFLVSLPMRWAPRHRDIKAILEKALGIDVDCQGGGFVMWVNNLPIVTGFSADYGPGDHELAKQELSSCLQGAGSGRF